MTACARVATAVASLLASLAVQAADMCPAPPHYVPRSAAEVAADDHKVHIDTDDASVAADGIATLSGHVAVRQDERIVTADLVTVDQATGRITVKGAVDFLDPKLRITSRAGSYDQSGQASFDQADFQLFDHAGRGYAREIDLSPAGRITLAATGYTACPPGKTDWMIRADSIELDTASQSGVARGVKLDFDGVPLLYLPYFSFPLGDERKSGFLFPSINHSGKDGVELPVPYYFNLAPNYDLTLTPEELTSRGVELGADFRYLTAASHGEFEGTFLPDDRQTGSERSYLRLRDVNDLGTHRCAR